LSPGGGSALRSLGLGLAVLVGCVVFRAGVGGPLQVAAPTLSPSISAGDVVWVWKWAVQPMPGDAVWVEWPATGQTGAYRVIACGPTRVEVDQSGRAIVDGEPENWRGAGELRLAMMGGVEVPIIPGGPSMPEQELPAATCFVLSDARPVSGDSRVHGGVPQGAVLGTISRFSVPSFRFWGR